MFVKSCPKSICAKCLTVATASREINTTVLSKSITMAFMQALPTAIVEVNNLLKAMEEDEKRGTTRNTTEALIGTVGAIMGAAKAIAAADEEPERCHRQVDFVEVVARTMQVTAVANSTDKFTREIASNALDLLEHDVKEIRCTSCEQIYKCRLYTDQSQEHCETCEERRAFRLH